MEKNEIESRVALPQGFSAQILDNKVILKGNGREVSHLLSAKGVSVRQEGSELVVSGGPSSKRINALVGTVSTHLGNLVSGLQSEYAYTLAVVYSHFPMNVSVKGGLVEIKNFVGEKNPRYAKILPGVNVTVKGKEISVKGTSKEAAGQTAANIESAAKVKGKDKRVYQDGIFIIQKAFQESKGGK